MATITEFTFGHYNLNDLFTPELQTSSEKRPDLLAQTILDSAGTVPDFMSLCELAYDSPSVPTKQYTSCASNVDVFCQRICQAAKNVFNPAKFDTTTFAMGNCGTDGRAIPLPNGDYYCERNATSQNKLAYGDLVNCRATQPGQYGVGFWSSFPIKNVHYISKLNWSDFNPSIDLNLFDIPSRTGTGSDPVPQNITLFDKCFIDATVDLNGTLVHFIMVHNMPAFAFGESKSPNIARNNDQLAFLEWYLTGKTYFDITCTVRDDSGTPVKPLDSSAVFIAAGDLNSDFRAGQSGSQRLINIMNSNSIHVFPKGQTTEINGTTQLQLDYIFWRGLDLVPGSGKIGPMDETNLSDHACLTAKFRTQDGSAAK